MFCEKYYDGYLRKSTVQGFTVNGYEKELGKSEEKMMQHQAMIDAVVKFCVSREKVNVKLDWETAHQEVSVAKKSKIQAERPGFLTFTLERRVTESCGSQLIVA